jgi:hypothetical protein
MAADFRDAYNTMVDVVEYSNGVLVEHREDVGAVTEWNPAILNAKTCSAPVTGSVQIEEGCLISSGILALSSGVSLYASTFPS